VFMNRAGARPGSISGKRLGNNEGHKIGNQTKKQLQFSFEPTTSDSDENVPSSDAIREMIRATDASCYVED
jgi:hypothetical protein